MQDWETIGGFEAATMLSEDWVYRYFDARLLRAIPPTSAPNYPVDRPFDPAEAIDVLAFMGKLHHEVLTQGEPADFEIAVKGVVPSNPRDKVLSYAALRSRVGTRLKNLLRHEDADLIRKTYRVLFRSMPGSRRRRSI